MELPTLTWSNLEGTMTVSQLQILGLKTSQAIGILGSPKFTKASARAMRAIATFQDTRWFINTFTYFPLSFCLEKSPRSLGKDLMVVKEGWGYDACLPCNPDNKHAARKQAEVLSAVKEAEKKCRSPPYTTHTQVRTHRSLTYLPHI